MPLETRVFAIPKDPQHPEQYQDAYGLDAAEAVAVVADGVSSAIFSRQWANILVDAVPADIPNPTEKDCFAAWLAQRRQEWSEQIDTSGLAWFQKAKLPTGAFSTLLWVRVMRSEAEEPGSFGALRLHGFAIGDSCLFHVRGGETVRTFPLQNADQFQDNPIVLGSVDLGRDDFLEFNELDEHCYHDDLLVLCTDAVAEWALRESEAGNPPNWDEIWHMNDGQWEDLVAQLRETRQMRYDDTTLLLLRVVPKLAGPELAEPELAEPETAELELAEPEAKPVEEQSEQTSPIAEAVKAIEAAAANEATGESPEAVTEPPAEQSSEEAADDDWAKKFKSAGEQFTEGLEIASGQALRGLKKWKDKAVRKYRDKLKKDQK